jgi:hypothetical protein
VALACLDGVAATVSCTEDPAPSWRLGTKVRAAPLLMAHEAEAAAGSQRECLGVGGAWLISSRTSDTAPSAHGHVSPPRSE